MDPAADDIADSFRLALRGIAATVCVITASDGRRTHGMTVTSVTSLTLSPPALLVCVNRAAAIGDVVRLSSGFCVNVLGDGHEAVSRAFSGGTPPEERFDVGDWRTDAESGAPYLADAQSALICRKAAAMPYGTHIILIGDVTRVIAGSPCGPLIYQNAGYAALPRVGQ